MPTYQVTDPASGRRVELTGDTPPTDEDLDEIFKSLPPAESKPQDKTFLQKAGQVGKDLVTGAVGRDIAGAVVTGAIAQPVAGLAGLASAPFVGLEHAGQITRDTQEALTMKPQSETGKKILNAVGTVAGLPGKFGGYVGEKIGGPDAGRTIGENLPDAVLAIIGFKGPKSLKQAALKAEIEKDPTILTPEVQKTLEDHGLGEVANMVDPNQAERLNRFSQFGAKPTQGELTQKLEDLKPEQALLESSVDETGRTFQTFKRDQSSAIRTSVDKTIDSLGVPAEVGNSVKEILASRKKVLKETRRNAYEQLSQAADGQSIPVITNRLLDGMPDKGVRRTIEKTLSNQAAPNALKELLVEFGVDDNPAIAKNLTDSGVEITPLTLGNAEAFRRRLGTISKSDQSGQMEVLIRPIRHNLDNEIDLISQTLEKSGNPNVAELAKQARQSNIALKTEFDPKSITEKLISKNTNSVLPTVEESKVYQTISANSTPVEEVSRLMDSIEATGSKKAAGDLQSAMLLDLIDSAYSATSRKIDGVPVFGGPAFQARYKILAPKIEVVFRSNPEALQRIKALNEVAKDLTIDSRAMPKGSAGFFIDQLYKVGLNPIMRKVGGGAAIEALTSFSKLANNRNALRNAMKAKPELRETASVLATDYPGIAAALGVGYLTSTKESSSSESSSGSSDSSS